MSKIRMSRRRILTTGSALGALGALTGSGPAFAGSESNAEYRWDIVSIDFAKGEANAGGEASARANDRSKMTMTGSGTFRVNAGHPQAFSGGGAWKHFDPNGKEIGGGTYQVNRFVKFTPEVGSPPPLKDNIGKDARAGLAVLCVKYNDGVDGVLVVSCHLVGTPDNVFEGITASKGSVDYWEREAPAPQVDHNRTLFHRLR